MSEIKLVRPDILDCLANLSSDEVFTPPKVVNEMLDMLPQDLFENPKTRFLDPFTKSGVFLRETVKRLDKGLVRAIPDKEDRLNHIFQRQVYGIACTQLTALFSRRSLYCNKNVQDKRSTARGLFSTEAGNIGYHRCHHTWVNGSCKVCGASKKALSESKDVENYAYPFLHDEVFMKQAQELGFDVIIGNPPYQMKDGGNAASAVPIYQKFVSQAKRLNPRYLSMITPSRWFTGGRGLEAFRDEMLHDDRLIVIHDYIDASDCFPGVEIKGGVSFFLWARDTHGQCKIVTHRPDGKVTTSKRDLLEKGMSSFVRYAEQAEILKKVQLAGEESFMSMVSANDPFGYDLRVEGSYKRIKPKYVLEPKKGLLEFYYNGWRKSGIGYINESTVRKNKNWINQYKLLVPQVWGCGDASQDRIQPFIVGKNSVCSETYVVRGPFKRREDAENAVSYIQTKFFHFMVSIIQITHHATQTMYSLVPMKDFSKPWTDAELYKKYKLTDQEIEFIESMIRPME